jgi:hypothetical protein
MLPLVAVLADRWRYPDFIRRAAPAHGHFPQTPLYRSLALNHDKKWGCFGVPFRVTGEKQPAKNHGLSATGNDPPA